MNRESLGGATMVESARGLGGRAWLALAFLLLALSALLPAGVFAAPPAGAIIGNQATASYTDAGGNDRTTTSNLVETTITQIAGVDVEANQTRTAAPGSTVYLPHTVTNTGNGNDVYNLLAAQVAGGTFSFSSIVIYADVNGDGIPDSFTPITVTPTLAAGQTYGIVIAAQVPGAAASGQSSQLTITGTSQFDGAITDFNTDTVTVSTNAVVPVTKSLSVQSGPALTEVEVTLTYTNNGSKTATNLTLTDVLDARYAYVANSGRWSVTNPTVLTDLAADADTGGIAYGVNAQTVTAVIASVAPGQSGFVRFKVTVVAGTAPGTIPNTGNVSYGDGDGNTVVTDTNTSTFIVTAAPAVDLTDVGSTTDADGANDVVLIASANQGATLIFDNVVVNNGTGVDTFDITYGNSTFPAGTSFQLLRAGGTPMTDSNGNGIPDTGPLAAGASFHVHLRVILPNNVAAAGPFDVIKTATSTIDPTVKDTVTDRLGSLTANTVDITNNASLATNPAAPGVGVNANGEAAAVTTNTINPGQTTSFSLFINNTSAVSDSYNLAASTDNTFGALTLPAGWSVTFRNASTNAVISNTGTIAAGGNLRVLAEVSVPAGQAPGTTSLYFRAQSPTSGALDVKHDAVTVNTVVDLAITPNNTSQGFPGGQVVYKHTLTNNGNAAVAAATLVRSESTPLWNSVIWYDANGNGVIDAGDIVVNDLADIVAANPALAGGLPAGGQVPLLVQVFVPSGATDGAANATTITVTAVGDSDPSNNVAVDTTTVVVGDVQVRKLQALDAACDGTADGAFVQTLLSAKPDECLIYRVTLTNLGTLPITGSSISDTTPSFTTYVGASATVTSGTVTAQPAAGTAGVVTATVGTVNSGSSATLEFSVRINP